MTAPIREPDEIRQQAARKLRSVTISDHFQPILGFLLNEDTYYVQMSTAQGLVTLPRKDFRKFDVRQTSIMPSYRGKLADSELTDLVAYLWTLQRPRAGQDRGHEPRGDLILEPEASTAGGPSGGAGRRRGAHRPDTS